MVHPRQQRAIILTLTAFSLWACPWDKTQQQNHAKTPKPEVQIKPETPPASKPAPKPAAKLPPATKLPTPARLVAIGDVHGDIRATRAALSLAGAIDDKDRWIGGSLVVVQTGDQLDRGDDEQAILDLLTQLQKQATEAGGALVILNGNHEVMNVRGDLRYVTPGGLVDFQGIEGVNTNDPRLGGIPKDARARAAAFLPGAPYALVLAKRGVIAIVGDSIFAHGGVLPEHVRYGIDAINNETSAWMRGETAEVPPVLRGKSSPIWSRHFSDDPVDAEECALLKEMLDLLHIKRLVVGHTVQKTGITSACDERVWRIDTGMAAHYGGKAEVLEITEKGIKILRAQ